MKVIFALFFLAIFLYFIFFALKSAGLICNLPALSGFPQILELAECPTI